jgi:serine/threonine protein phosphatase PrpC
MVKRYLHFEVKVDQRAKKQQQACGDVVSVVRNETMATVIVCDGIGSGTAAYTAARMCQSRIERLLDEKFSLREAFLCVAASMEHWKQPGKPYAAFTIAQIRNDGAALILGYESPQAIWVTARQAQTLTQRKFLADGICGYESTCYLEPGEGLLLLTDGVTQAGIDTFPGGWQSEGVAGHISSLLSKKQLTDLTGHIQSKALSLNGGIDYDDATAAWIQCRQGRSLCIWTGPPAERLMDMAIAERFYAMPGKKVVCGATTSSILARTIGKQVQIEKEPTSLIAPPKYFLDGVDLVTEGAVTLNQLNNVLELQPDDFYEISAVTELYDLLSAADRVHIFLGSGKNPANEDSCFVQRGVLSREDIVPLIAQKLRRQGKCVIVESV